jgi:succinate dehydrogenase / fumarate reductase, membrane anchor subunit
VSGRSALGRVRGLGSAKAGAHHWWLQRLTSVALVPLGVWFLVSLLTLPALSYATVIAWLHELWTAVFLLLTILVAAWHSRLGVQVVVEDYVHDSGLRTLALALSDFAHVLIVASAGFAVLRVAFGALP